MYHLLPRGIAACGIFSTIAVVNLGYFWSGLRNLQIDCDKGSTHNGSACAVDWIQTIASTVVTVSSAAAAVVAMGFIPKRDSVDWHDWDVVYVDGQEFHKLEVLLLVLYSGHQDESSARAHHPRRISHCF